MKKVWKKQNNQELIVGNCKWCEKEIINTDAFITFASKEHSCIKCYRSSGAKLPFKINESIR